MNSTYIHTITKYNNILKLIPLSDMEGLVVLFLLKSVGSEGKNTCM